MNNTARPPMPTVPPIGPAPGAPAPPPEVPLRDRVARAKTLVRRGFKYWKVALLLFVVGVGLALVVAMRVKRTYKSECVVLAKPGIRTGADDNDSAEQRSAKLSARLKDALTTRSHLESAIKKFSLYPNTVDAKGLKDAADEMLPHVGFRALDSGRYVISFDSSEVEGRSTQDLVRDVTQYLAQSLIDDYASGDLQEKKQQLEFDRTQEQVTEQKLEKATQDFATFLLQHPEYAMEAKQAATTSPFGIAPNPASGIPLIPTGKDGKPTSGAPPPPQMDPALREAIQNDPQIGALWRERQRLTAQLQSTPAATPAPTATAASTAQAAQLQSQIDAAQADVEAAAKRVAEAQADLASKQATLGPENPDLKASQAQASQAAVALHQAKVRLATLQAQLTALTSPTPQPSTPAAVDPQNAEVLGKIKDVDAQIGAREAELKKQRGTTSAPAPSTSAAPAASAQPAPVAMNPVVQQETDYLRLFRDLTASKAANERAKLSFEKSQTAVEAAQMAANDLMQVAEPAYRPTAPYKGGRGPWAIGGFFLALVVAICYAAARVVFNDTLIDAQDIESLKLIPVLGVVPKIHVTAPSPAKDAGGGAEAKTAPKGAQPNASV